VEDTGPGIPEAERALVLQPFYRALGTNVDGSGLGLAIVQEIAQQHGAELSITDARPRSSAAAQGIGPGALFTLRFAMRRLPSPADGASGAGSADGRRGGGGHGGTAAPDGHEGAHAPARGAPVFNPVATRSSAAPAMPPRPRRQ
jgi:hypothetical protein